MTTRPALQIDQEYAAANPRSRELYERQLAAVPGGITHWTRGLLPFPLFIARNEGSRKWDVDGHEYVDYWVGHGAMLLGHGHPVVVEAVRQAAGRGFHAGGETELGAEWAELVRRLVPCAAQVRFMASGGEATQMALRVARAYTGKDKIIKFEGCFHGWHDAVALGVMPPYEVPMSPGIPQQVQDTVLVLPFNDLEPVRRTLDSRSDVAGIIVEAGGPRHDAVPIDPAFLRGLRELATRHRVVFIMDEVITGFRYAVGGAQEYFGVTPDLTTLGKIVSGGLPAGALVGKASVMEVLAYKADPEWNRYHAVPQWGTWNAAPIVAAAGVATLKLVETGEPVRRAIDFTQRMIAEVNAVFREVGVAGFLYGRTSLFHTCAGEPPRMVAGDFSCCQEEMPQLDAGWGALTPVLRKALVLEGVDLMANGGFVSAAHSDEDLERTVHGFRRALQRLQREGALKG